MSRYDDLRRMQEALFLPQLCKSLLPQLRSIRRIVRAGSWQAEKFTYGRYLLFLRRSSGGCWARRRSDMKAFASFFARAALTAGLAGFSAPAALAAPRAGLSGRDLYLQGMREWWGRPHR
jgi:hypothetical protein